VRTWPGDAAGGLLWGKISASAGPGGGEGHKPPQIVSGADGVR
jgi:hypothetical protein